MLEKTDSLINDVLELLTEIDNNFPSITNEYLVKIALIYFNLDVETVLKDWLANNDVSKAKFSNMFDFCNFYNTNFNNPNITKLKEIYKKFDLQWPKLSNSDETAYHNIILARNKINHNPYNSLSVNFNEIKLALEIAKKILKPFEKKK
jgi:hypothetical protein